MRIEGLVQEVFTVDESNAIWGHPILDLFEPPASSVPQRARLYSVPSLFGEIYENDDAPQPTSASELPGLHRWITTFAISTIEVWAGRRQPAQLLQRCHRVVFNELLRKVGSVKTIGKIKSIHISEPLDGICEAVVIIDFSQRIQALSIRCEGVDGRWLCTSLKLLQ
jgi:Family of unknown function (DUF6459)